MQAEIIAYSEPIFVTAVSYAVKDITFVSRFRLFSMQVINNISRTAERGTVYKNDFHFIPFPLKNQRFCPPDTSRFSYS